MKGRALVVAAALATFGCKKAPDALRDALIDGDVVKARATVDAPECKEPFTTPPERGCLREIAKAFGTKTEFNASSPDQAAGSAVALVLIRERRGDIVPMPDRWALAMKIAKGSGGDALRLATALRMAELAPRVAKSIDDEKEARALVHDIGTAIPGACATYAMLGGDAPIESMAPEKSPDHAPCVQRDLIRKGAPGEAYGYGIWRAVAGAIALWKDEAEVLRAGAEQMEGKAKEALLARLAVIDEASRKVTYKQVEAPGRDWASGLGAAHDMAFPHAGDGGTPAPASSR